VCVDDEGIMKSADRQKILIRQTHWVHSQNFLRQSYAHFKGGSYLN
jgi:hypothetical protein